MSPELGERICQQLTRIANALESFVPDPEPPAVTEPPPCLHPEELRVSFGMTRGLEDWQCGVPTCQYRTVAEP